MTDNKYSPPAWLTAWVEHIEIGPALDLGAGSGGMSSWLAERGFQLTAVEKEKSALSRLRPQAEVAEISVVEEDFAQLEFMPDFYSLIIAAASLHFLLPQHLPSLADSLIEALAPGGFLMAEVFTVDDPSYAERKAGSEQIAADTFTLMERSGVIHYFQKGELRSLFSGLQILSYQEDRRLDRTGEYGYRAGAALVARRWNR